MSNILERIVSVKRQEVAAARDRIALATMRSLAEAHEGGIRPFESAIASQVAAGHSAVIAEVKKASPSRGLIRPHFDPAWLAHRYAQAGATCLSVLTDTRHFQGSADDLQAARSACDLPVLRKDFLVDPYQVYESRAMGADCILLIAACLDDGLMREMEDIAHQLGMSVLAEVHDRDELARASTLRTRLIGINNRDLRSFEVALSVTLDMVNAVPPGRIVVTESGIHRPADVQAMHRADVRAFLVGEALLTSDDPGRGLQTLFGGLGGGPG